MPVAFAVAALSAHLASSSPISILICLSSSTSSGLSLFEIGQDLRSYSTGLCVRISCGGPGLNRTLLPRSQLESRRDEGRRRKHGRSLVGEEERRLLVCGELGGVEASEGGAVSVSDDASRLGDDGGGSECSSEESAGGDHGRLERGTTVSTESSGGGRCCASGSAVCAAGLVGVTVAARSIHSHSGDGTAGTVSEGETDLGGRAGGPDNSNENSGTDGFGITVREISQPSSTISAILPFLREVLVSRRRGVRRV